LSLIQCKKCCEQVRELHTVLYDENFDMVFVTETWLHTDVSSGLLDPKSKYVILRKDRNGKGGGVCAFVKRNINVMTIDISTAFSILEVLCFDVIFSSRDNLRFFVVYRPPYCGDVANHYLQILINRFTQFATNSKTNIIVGDFNCPGINWNSFTSTNDIVSNSLLKYMVESGFQQFVNC